MAVKLFKIESLPEFDGGRIAAAVEQELKKAALDCMDRPAEERARTVNLQFELCPVRDEHGQCEGVTLDFQIVGKCPTRKSKTYHLGIKQTGGLFFSEHSPENVNQKTIMDGGSDTHPVV